MVPSFLSPRLGLDLRLLHFPHEDGILRVLPLPLHVPRQSKVWACACRAGLEARAPATQAWRTNSSVPAAGVLLSASGAGQCWRQCAQSPAMGS